MDRSSRQMPHVYKRLLQPERASICKPSFFQGNDKGTMENKASKKHIILVHGAFHGAWCWYKVTTLLRSAGYRVTVPDLSASGIDKRQLDEVHTFVEYTQPLLDIISSLPAGERVILVGHSLGGMNIALAADQFPEKIEAVVFVTAFMPDCSSNPSFYIDKLKEAPQEFWMDTRFGDVAETHKRRPDSLVFGPQFMSSSLYQLCPKEDLTLAASLVRPGPLFEDLATLPPFSKTHYGSVDKVYIICKQDGAISEDLQRAMIEKYPVKEVKEIDEAESHGNAFMSQKVVRLPHGNCRLLRLRKHFLILYRSPALL